MIDKFEILSVSISNAISYGFTTSEQRLIIYFFRSGHLIRRKVGEETLVFWHTGIASEMIIEKFEILSVSIRDKIGNGFTTSEHEMLISRMN
ncbi:MAG: hypothetical protein OCD76_00050 [Reichenbachiella sp.]